jgi:hypothetical protein
MKKIVTQLKPGMLIIQEEYLDTPYDEYKNNQLLVTRLTRLNKEYEPSIEQNGLLFACFKLVMENREEPHFKTVELVKQSCKIGIDYRDPSVVIVRPDGGVQFQYLSFAFDKLRGKKRDVIMQQAFEWCADILGYEDDIRGLSAVEKMVVEAKSRMKKC